MAERVIKISESAHKDLKHRYYVALVRGDRLGEENKNLKQHNEALRIIEHCALSYCEAASEGLPTAKLDALFSELIDALGWRKKAREEE